MNGQLEVVVLAAGKGTRMCSDKPKVLHHLAGKSFLEHVLDRAKPLDATATHIVVGHGAELVQTEVADYKARFVIQAEQLGTGHAVTQTLNALHDESVVLILYGDVPLIKTSTLGELIDLVVSDTMALLTVDMVSPKGYGRILRDTDNNVIAIVEEKDASDEQKCITEVNTGVMAVRARDLKRWLPALSNSNAQGEYYLTDIIAMAAHDNIAVHTAQPANEYEVLGINNRAQQAQVERFYQQELAAQLMDAGVTLMDPSRFDCRGSVTAGRDCFIDINCVFEGHVELGNNVSIGANCVIKDTQIADHTDIKPFTMVDSAVLGTQCSVGPFARLREGTRLSTKAKIGNFVETKKAMVGTGSKINHLSYVGDAVLGADVNIGAGTITCNYDGANKHQTNIEDNVFIGSNSALVAPITIGNGTTVAAGSTITRNVESDHLVMARSKQKSIHGWVRPVKK